jgi:hypothetical protein
VVMLVSETWRVSSKVLGRLCVNLWSCGCVSTLNQFCPPFNELILGWEIRQIRIVIRLLKEMNFKCRLLSA